MKTIYFRFGLFLLLICIQLANNLSWGHNLSNTCGIAIGDTRWIGPDWFDKYPFLFDHSELNSPFTVYRANSVNPADLANLKEYLHPGKNPKNLGIISEEERRNIIISYLDKGPLGAKELGENHLYEIEKYYGKRVSVLSSWGKEVSEMYGLQTPERIRVIAALKLTKSIPVIVTNGEYQLLDQPVGGHIDWFLQVNGRTYSIQNQSKFVDFIKLKHGEKFSKYSDLTAQQKIYFWNHEVDALYESLANDIDNSLRAGQNIGLQSFNTEI